MDLQNWLDLKNLTHQQFADMCGCSRHAVTRWANQTRQPSAKWMKVIHRKTGGEVGLRLFKELRNQPRVYTSLRRKGYTIASASKKLRIHRNTLSRFLRGKARTPLHIVQKIRGLAFD